MIIRKFSASKCPNEFNKRRKTILHLSISSKASQPKRKGAHFRGYNSHCATCNTAKCSWWQEIELNTEMQAVHDRRKKDHEIDRWLVVDR